MNRDKSIVSHRSLLFCISLSVVLGMSIQVFASDTSKSTNSPGEYSYTFAGTTVNLNPVEIDDSYLEFEILNFCKSYISVGALNIFKDGINARTKSFFYLPAGVFVPITRTRLIPDFSDEPALLSARALLYTLDGDNLDTGLQPKAYEVSLQYEAAMLWCIDLTYRGVFDEDRNRYEYLEGFFVGFSLRLGGNVWF